MHSVAYDRANNVKNNMNDTMNYRWILIPILMLSAAATGYGQPTPVAIDQIKANAYFKDFLGDVPYHLEKGLTNRIDVFDNRFLQLYGRAVADLHIEIGDDNRIQQLEMNLLHVDTDTTFFKEKLNELYQLDSESLGSNETNYYWKPAGDVGDDDMQEIRLRIRNGSYEKGAILMIEFRRNALWW